MSIERDLLMMQSMQMGMLLSYEIEMNLKSLMNRERGKGKVAVMKKRKVKGWNM
jgi:hypothetical protein